MHHRLIDIIDPEINRRLVAIEDFDEQQPPGWYIDVYDPEEY